MTKKVLAVLTNRDSYETGERTGLWLSELTHFYDALTGAGCEVVTASPKGGRIPLDPRSLKSLYMDDSARTFLELPERKPMLEETRPLSGIQAETYAAIFFAGGHGTMWDFRDDPDIRRLITDVYESGGVVGAVCHGVAALVSATDRQGNSLVARRAVTGFSNIEETLLDKHSKVPYLLERELVGRGALYSRGWLPFLPYAVADGRIVTGQNPQSTRAVAKLMLAVLQDKPQQGTHRTAKCLPCLAGTWVVGLSAIAWGAAGLFGIGGLALQGSPLALIVGGIGIWFLYFQYPFRSCSRCVAAARTRESLASQRD